MKTLLNSWHIGSGNSAPGIRGRQVVLAEAMMVKAMEEVWGGGGGEGAGVVRECRTWGYYGRGGGGGGVGGRKLWRVRLSGSAWWRPKLLSNKPMLFNGHLATQKVRYSVCV